MNNFIFVLQRPDGCVSTQEALQDVDDWDLTELNPDWDIGESDVPSPLPPVGHHILSFHAFDSRNAEKHFLIQNIFPWRSPPSASLQTKPHQPL